MKRRRCLLKSLARKPVRTVDDVFQRHLAQIACVCRKCEKRRAEHEKALAHFKSRPLLALLRRRRGMTTAGATWTVPVRVVAPLHQRSDTERR